MKANKCLKAWQLHFNYILFHRHHKELYVIVKIYFMRVFKLKCNSHLYFLLLNFTIKSNIPFIFHIIKIPVFKMTFKFIYFWTLGYFWWHIFNIINQVWHILPVEIHLENYLLLLCYP